MYRTLGRAKEQLFLLPENITDWVCEDDFSLILLDLVSLLDLSPLFKEHREDGQGAAFYHPEIMIGLIIHSYFHGVRSSRQIEMKCRYDVGYRIVTRNSCPDHTTISALSRKTVHLLEISLSLCYLFSMKLGLSTTNCSHWMVRK